MFRRVVVMGNHFCISSMLCSWLGLRAVRFVEHVELCTFLNFCSSFPCRIHPQQCPVSLGIASPAHKLVPSWELGFTSHSSAPAMAQFLCRCTSSGGITCSNVQLLVLMFNFLWFWEGFFPLVFSLKSVFPWIISRLHSCAVRGFPKFVY